MCMLMLTHNRWSSIQQWAAKFLYFPTERVCHCAKGLPEKYHELKFEYTSLCPFQHKFYSSLFKLKTITDIYYSIV